MCLNFEWENVILLDIPQIEDVCINNDRAANVDQRDLSDDFEHCWRSRNTFSLHGTRHGNSFPGKTTQHSRKEISLSLSLWSFFCQTYWILKYCLLKAIYTPS